MAAFDKENVYPVQLADTEWQARLGAKAYKVREQVEVKWCSLALPPPNHNHVACQRFPCVSSPHAPTQQATIHYSMYTHNSGSTCI